MRSIDGRFSSTCFPVHAQFALVKTVKNGKSCNQSNANNFFTHAEVEGVGVSIK